jgi:hypothetical protein
MSVGALLLPPLWELIGLFAGPDIKRLDGALNGSDKTPHFNASVQSSITNEENQNYRIFWAALLRTNIPKKQPSAFVGEKEVTTSSEPFAWKLQSIQRTFTQTYREWLTPEEQNLVSRSVKWEIPDPSPKTTELIRRVVSKPELKPTLMKVETFHYQDRGSTEQLPTQLVAELALCTQMNKLVLGKFGVLTAPLDLCPFSNLGEVSIAGSGLTKADLIIKRTLFIDSDEHPDGELIMITDQKAQSCCGCALL